MTRRERSQRRQLETMQREPLSGREAARLQPPVASSSKGRRRLRSPGAGTRGPCLGAALWMSPVRVLWWLWGPESCTPRPSLKGNGACLALPYGHRLSFVKSSLFLAWRQLLKYQINGSMTPESGKVCFFLNTSSSYLSLARSWVQPIQSKKDPFLLR